MDALRDLTTLIEDLTQARSFKDAAERFTRGVRTLTGCQAAILRLLEEGDEGPWLAGCTLDGPSESFARDEIMVSGAECICGRVATGLTDPRYPFYTEGGSFHWGRLGTLAQDFTAEETGPLRGRCTREEYESLAVLPLRAGERVVGSLHLADRRPDLFAGSVEMLECACRLAGGILLRHKAEEREHAVLEAIQAALLPATPPQVEGLSIGVSFTSATELARLGGDFYDVLDLGTAGVLILVGDASGKGVEAASMAARARYAMEAYASLAIDPASFMGTTNEALLRLLPSEHFVTAAACLIHRDSGCVTTCLAGHPAPLHLKALKGSKLRTTEVRAPHNPPLGVFPGLRFAEKIEGFTQDDVLLIYTDGVSDSRRGSSLFGTHGIVRAARMSADQEPGDIARSVCASATGYHDPFLPADDRLVMAVRLCGKC